MTNVCKRVNCAIWNEIGSVDALKIAKCIPKLILMLFSSSIFLVGIKIVQLFCIYYIPHTSILYLVLYYKVFQNLYGNNGTDSNTSKSYFDRYINMDNTHLPLLYLLFGSIYHILYSCVCPLMFENSFVT